MELITIKEATKILSVSDQTVRKLIRNKQIVAYKLGKEYRINKDSLDVFLDTIKYK